MSIFKPREVTQIKTPTAAQRLEVATPEDRDGIYEDYRIKRMAHDLTGNEIELILILARADFDASSANQV